MKKIIDFFVTTLIFAWVYFFFNKDEIEASQNYDFLVIAVLVGSSTFVVPILQRWTSRLFKRK